jgi:hypothetical protein
VTFGGGEIDETALAEHVDFAAIAHGEFFDELARRAPRGGHLGENIQIDFDVEVAGVAKDRPFFMRSK